MAGNIYNSLQTKKQKDWYRDIALFGDKQTIPLDVINAVLLLGNLESQGFKEKIASGTGPRGLLQFGPRRWKDITIGGNKWYDDTRNLLKDWRYKIRELNRDKPKDQIAVIYAEAVSYTQEFKSATKPGGERDEKHYGNAWEAYDKACEGLGKDCPTDPYERYVLFIQAAHHGPSKIHEVISGWKKQIQPNIKDNLEFLKSKRKEWKMKVSQDDTEAPTDKFAEAEERDSERTAPAEQPDDAYSAEDRKRKDIAAGGGAEAETAGRVGDSERGIPKSWIADAGNVLSDASNDARRSTFQVANEPMDVEKAPDAMKLREAPAGFLAEPGSPLQYAIDALGVKADEVQFSREAGSGNSASGSGTITDKSTLKNIGSYTGTPTGCEMTLGDRKVVMDRISGSDVYVETYAKNDDGDYELQGTTRIGDKDGITVRRPWTGMA